MIGLQRFFQAAIDILNALRRGGVGIVGIAHTETVKDQPVCQRVDVGRKNLQSGAAESAGEPVKNAGGDVFVRTDDKLEGARLGQVTMPNIDVAGANSANGTQVQLYTCNGTGAQQWTIGDDGTIRALGKCLDVAAASSVSGSCRGRAVIE